MLISNEDQRRIGAAIAAVEGKTGGEIVCVLARNASDYVIYPLAWAAFAAFVLPWILMATTQLSVQRLFMIQIVVFAVLFLVLGLPPIRARLVPRRVARVTAHRVAMEQFMVRGLTRKPNRAAILIFVSLTERYARIIADDGIASKVDRAVWQGAVDALIAHMRDGRLAEGFLAAIERSGAVLIEHVPPGGEPGSLPDRIYVI